jgi:filamentous hemagglutinin family protein
MQNERRFMLSAGFAMRALAVAIGAIAWQQALANPTGPTVVHGSASFTANSSALTVTNSPNTIIHWQSFSIGAGEVTRFNQQSAASAVLNRVTTPNDPSSILGSLQSNGRVFLINPSGIVFGQGARIDVGGLVASTLNLSNEDFLAGRLRFAATPGAGSVVNHGEIRTSGAGAPVYLVGPAVTNGGLITSPQGEVMLAAGQSVEVVNPGTPNMSVVLTAPDNEALNVGSIIADAGRVNIYAGLIRQDGLIQANSALSGEDGIIRLQSTTDILVDVNALTGEYAGGELRFDAGGEALLGWNNRLTSLQGTAGGDLSFGNVAPTLTVPGLRAGGYLTVSQYHGDLIITGDVTSSGPYGQSLFASGNLVIKPAGAHGITVRSEAGPQVISAAGDVLIQGGVGPNAFALVSSAQDFTFVVGGHLRLSEGATPHAWARVQTDAPVAAIALSFLHPAGSWFVNGVEGALRQRQSGFWSGQVVDPE